MKDQSKALKHVDLGVQHFWDTSKVQKQERRDWNPGRMGILGDFRFQSLGFYFSKLRLPKPWGIATKNMGNPRSGRRRPGHPWDNFPEAAGSAPNFQRSKCREMMGKHRASRGAFGKCGVSQKCFPICPKFSGVSFPHQLRPFSQTAISLPEGHFD